MDLSVSVESQASNQIVLLVAAPNDSPSGVYALDALRRPDADNQPEDDSQPGYRFAFDGALYVLLGPCPLPNDRDVYFQFMPRGSWIEPGGEYQARLVLPVPVEEYTLYADGEGRPDMAECARIVVGLAVLDAAPAEVVPEAEPAGRGVELSMGSIKRAARWLHASVETAPFRVSLGLTDADRVVPF